MLREITMWLVASGLVPSAGFVLLYGFTSPWWRSPGGRHLMSFAVAAFLLFSWGFFALYIGDYPGRRLLRTLAAASFVGLAWWRFLVLLHLHFGMFRHHFNGDPMDKNPGRRSDDPPPCGASTLRSPQAEESEDARGRHTTEP